MTTTIAVEAVMITEVATMAEAATMAEGASRLSVKGAV